MNSVQVRDELISELRKYMIGPHWGNDEVIDTNPKFTYMTGILYPQDSEVIQENLPDEENSTKDDEVRDTASINFLNLYSFGLTCMLNLQTKEIKINVNYGIYHTSKIEIDKKKKSLYRRVHFEQQELITIPTEVEAEKIIPLEIIFGELKIYFKRTSTGILCSVYMLNQYRSHESPTSKIIFQPCIEIISEKNQIIHNIPKDFSKVKDRDESLFDLIFDKKRNFGFGHGCSVSWNDSDVIDGNVGKICTTFLPEYKQNKIEPLDPKSLPDPKSIQSCLSMKTLSEENDYTKYSELLSEFPKLYSNWINTELESNLEKISDKKTGELQIKRCQDTLNRIKEGINIISTDPAAGKAFQFMNKVMSIQRLCVVTVKKKY